MFDDFFCMVKSVFHSLHFRKYINGKKLACCSFNSLCFVVQLRNPKDVGKEDYDTFYKSTFKEFIDAQAYVHFTTEVSVR